MELNAEQIKKALECCTSGRPCRECEYKDKSKDTFGCRKKCLIDALSLINSQEQRIGAQDMTISELRKRVEKAEHNADRYAKMIKELTEEVADLKAIAEQYQNQFEDCYEEKQKITEENERLRNGI